jgi:MFS family permease
MTASQIVGQVVGGYLGDRISKRLIVITCMGMHAVGLLLLAHVDAIAATVAFAVLHGSAWGARGPLMQAIRADYFGRASFGKIMGWSSMITMFGTVSGPFIVGWVYDRSQSYAFGFSLIALLSVLGSIFFILATRPPLPKRPDGSEPPADPPALIAATH